MRRWGGGQRPADAGPSDVRGQTVLVDGEPMSSCHTFAALVDGAEVRTVEGLATDPRLRPLPHELIDYFRALRGIGVTLVVAEESAAAVARLGPVRTAVGPCRRSPILPIAMPT